MYLKKITKSPFLLISLLSIANLTHVETTQDSTFSIKDTKLVIPTIILTFLSKQLNKLPNATERTSLFEALDKFQHNPETLTQKQKQAFSEYINKETIQLNKDFASIKDDKERRQMQEIYQTLTSFKEAIPKLYNIPSTETSNTQQPATLLRPHELLIPANGQCLYTSIILGYLLPVVERPNEFNARVQRIVDAQNLPITHNELVNHYQDLQYLDNDIGFQQVINSLLNQIGINPGIWGGPKEVSLIAEKLKVNIQEHTPNPDNPNQLITGTLYKPNHSTSQATIHIVQDIPLPQELIHNDDDFQLKQAKISSLQTSEHRHHYRLYYIGNLPQSLEEKEKYDERSYVTDEEITKVVIEENKLEKYHFDITSTYEMLGSLYDRQGNDQEAANTYHTLGLIYESQSRYEQAEKYIKRARKIRETKLGKYHLDTDLSYRTLGLLYYKKGNYKKAANTYHTLGLLHYDQGKHEEAEKYAKRALAILEGKLEKDHPDTANSYDILGLVCEARGEYEQAEKYYLKIIEIQESTLGTDHLDTANSCHILGLIYLKQGKNKKAEKYVNRALEIRKKKLGNNHLDTAIAYNILGSLHYKLTNYKEATNTYNVLGFLYYKQGKHKAAENCTRKALLILENKLGKDCLHTTITCYDILILIYQKQGENKKATKHAKSAIQVREKNLGTHHLHTAMSYNILAHLYHKGSKYEQAAKYYTKALEIRQRKLGSNHEATRSCCSDLHLVQSLQTVKYNKRPTTSYAKKRISKPIRRNSISTLQTHVETSATPSCLSTLQTYVETPMRRHSISGLQMHMKTPATTSSSLSTLQKHVEKPMRRHSISDLQMHVKTLVTTNSSLSTLQTHSETPIKRRWMSALQTHVNTPMRRHSISDLQTYVETPVKINSLSTLQTHIDAPMRRHSTSPSKVHIHKPIIKRRNSTSTLQTHVKKHIRRNSLSALKTFI